MLKFTVFLLILCCALSQPDRKQTKRGNKPPVVEKIEATPSSLTFCEQPTNGQVLCKEGNRTAVTLVVSAKDPEGGSLKYRWSASVGAIVGEGSQVTWDLAGQAFGSNDAKVTVSDSAGEETTATIKVPIEECPSCGIGGPPCPSVFVKSWDKVAHRAEKIVFYAETNPNWFFQSRPDYLWTVKGGKILKGEHSPQIEVQVTGEISSEVTAAVEVAGLDPACTNSTQWTVQITP